MVRHIFAALLCLMLIALPALAAESKSESDSLPETEGTVRVGDIAPDFNLTTLDNKPLNLHEMAKGKITVIVFWSFFCFPCQTEMPELQEFYNEYGSNVSVAAVALDGPQYNNFILPFIAEKKLTFPIAYDRESPKFFETAEKYGVIGTPTFFILDEALRVRFIHLGKLDKTLLKGMAESSKSKAYCSDIVKPQPLQQRLEPASEASKATPKPNKN